MTVYLVNEQDPRYLLAIDILGSDLNAVDQADQFLVFIRSKLKEKERYEKVLCMVRPFDVTAVFTACGTGIKNSSESSNSSVSMQTQNIEMEITDLVNLGSDPQAYMLYGSYRNEEEYKDEDGSYAEKHADDYDYMTLQLADSKNTKYRFSL